MDELTITRPDDWHTHLRDGDALATTVAHTAQRFARAIVMPNLSPPVTTTVLAKAYRERIRAHVPADCHFTPLMTLYLTDQTEPQEIVRAKQTDYILAAKLYPAGATTHSAAGVTALKKIHPVLASMEQQGLPLLVHGEVTDPEVDIFDREKYFIDRCLQPLRSQFPALRMVFEHITTREAVEFVQSSPAHVAATITPQHLMYNRNALLAGGIHPHHYCLPVLKREHHRRALLEAAISGNPKFFLGTDSAPHERSHKESACGCAGIYSAHAALEFYAEIFSEAGALNRLEAFSSFYGANFYGLPRNKESLTLKKASWPVPASYALGSGQLIPLRAGLEAAWRLV